MTETTTTKVFVVEDETKNRDELAKRLQSPRLGFDVRAPRTLEKTINQMLLERSDGGVFDVRLDEWGIGKSKPAYKVDGVEIRSGIDLAKFFSDINRDAPICFRSAYLDDPDVREEMSRVRFRSQPHIISKPLPPNVKEFENELKPFRDETLSANRANPLVSITTEKYRLLTTNEQLRLYKMALRGNKARLDRMIKVWGDFTWVALLDGTAYWAGGGHRLRGPAGLKVKERYPTEAEMRNVAARAKHPFFIFWNTKADMLGRVFKQAGPWLAEVPACAHSFFGLSVAPALADLYLAGERAQALAWGAELNDVGQLEVAKSVFKLLPKSKSVVAQFAQDFAEAGLPVVAEVFKAEVRKIEGRHTAWVELKKWAGGKATAEPFDLGRLQRCGVKYEDQMFEYTIYEAGTLRNVATNVEPTVAHEGNPFDHSPERGTEG